MMVHHVWTVLCRDATVDRDSTNISLFRAFSKITFTFARPTPRSGQPAAVGFLAPFDMRAVTKWIREDPDVGGRYEAQLRFVGLDDETLMSWRYDINLTGSELHHEIAVIQELPITGPGRYWFLVESRAAGTEGWHESARTALDMGIEWVESPEGDPNPDDVVLHDAVNR